MDMRRLCRGILLPGLTKDDIAKVLADIKPKDDAFEVGLLSDPQSLCAVKSWIPSGCLPLDIIMGGGYPVGRITEIYGDNSTGKSLLAAQAVAEAQAMGALAVFADVESAVSVPLMAELGVDADSLIYYTPDTVDQLIKILRGAIESKSKRLGAEHPMIFVWDSIAATTTLTEMEVIETEGLDKRQYASGAIQISAALRSGLPRL